MIGKDLNQRPDCSASRWVINFRDWPLDRAEQYPDCIDIVRRLVKPERDRNRDKHRREILVAVHAELRRSCIEAIEDLDARARDLLESVTRSCLFAIPTGQVFDHKCVVFALDDFASLAYLSSSMHSIWVIRYTSTMRTDISYSPSDVFLTLPRPLPTPSWTSSGEQLDRSRRNLMLSRSWGLTKTYNQVHDPDNHEPADRELRDIHVAIDEAVMRAYGWEDLDLKIGHHPTKIGIRWTVSKEARFELLDRLLEENHRRYQLENP